MPNIRTVNLSTTELNSVIADLKLSLNDLKQKNMEFVQRMTDRGKALVEENIMELGKINAFSTGELFNSVISVYDATSNVGIVEVTSEHAKFVEYGTGVQGTGTHPDPPAGWSNRQTPWIYENPKGSKQWFITDGEPAAPFFYNARNELEDEKLRIAKEVFRK